MEERHVLERLVLTSIYGHTQAENILRTILLDILIQFSTARVESSSVDPFFSERHYIIAIFIFMVIAMDHMIFAANAKKMFFENSHLTRYTLQKSNKYLTKTALKHHPEYSHLRFDAIKNFLPSST